MRIGGAGACADQRREVGAAGIRGVAARGAAGPEKILEFAVGVNHRSLTEVMARLGMVRVKSNFQFWTTTGNATGCLVPDTWEGEWIIDLNDHGKDSVRQVSRCLTAVTKKFFSKFRTLQASRDEVLRNDGSCMPYDGWKMVVLSDMALGDTEHLRKFLAAPGKGFGFKPDAKLLKAIRKEFPEIEVKG